MKNQTKTVLWILGIIALILILANWKKIFGKKGTSTNGTGTGNRFYAAGGEFPPPAPAPAPSRPPSRGPVNVNYVNCDSLLAKITALKGSSGRMDWLHNAELNSLLTAARQAGCNFDASVWEGTVWAGTSNRKNACVCDPPCSGKYSICVCAGSDVGVCTSENPT